MSGQIKLTLRQPPNVDFVHGYPGIPAGHDRPHAAVKGSVELRVGPGSPVKAKWIRVELKKIEILPGGGQSNTFSDVVGAGSFNVWTAKEDWEVVTTQDLPFQIRIPENIPPSVALENGSGIKYELVASLCYKAKKGLFRRESAPIMSTSAPIVIDKHELHAVWPVYSRPDLREVEKDGFVLVVDRASTCYGPGDRVLLRATVKSTTGSAFIRSYEMALRETAVFRAGPSTGHKSSPGPQVRSNFVGSAKLTLNAGLRAGLAHTVDLSCVIPPSHTTTTVVTAQHIEVVYSLAVRAMLDGGQALVIDNIPAMMSNWPRNVSEETVRRIGYAPHLSLDQAPPASRTSPRPQSQVINGTASSRIPQQRQQRPFTIVEKVGAGSTSNSHRLNAESDNRLAVADEFGAISNGKSGAQNGTWSSANGGSKRFSEDSAPLSQPAQSSTGSGTRPSSAGNTWGSKPPQVNRFAIANDVDGGIGPKYLSAAEEKAAMRRQEQIEIHQANQMSKQPQMYQPLESLQRQQSPSNRPSLPPAQVPGGSSGSSSTSNPGVNPAPPNSSISSGSGPRTSGWLSADDEKKKQMRQRELYQQAKQVAQVVQTTYHPTTSNLSPEASPISPPTEVSPGAPTTPPATAPTFLSPSSPAADSQWPSAGDEKRLRMFEEAQARVRRTHELAPSTSDDTQYEPAEAPYSNHGLEERQPPYQSPISSPGISAPLRQETSMQIIPPKIQSLPRQGISAGAALYQHAMASIVPTASASATSSPPISMLSDSKPSTPTPPANSSLAQPGRTHQRVITTSYPTPPASSSKSQNQWPDADQEKAQLRYMEARRAVETHQRNLSSPVAYDALYPSGSGSGITPPPNGAVPGPAYSPPSTGRTISFTGSVNENGQLRRHLDQVQAMTSLRGNVGGGPTPTPPPRRAMSPLSPSSVGPVPGRNSLCSNIQYSHHPGASTDSIPPGYTGSNAARPPSQMPSAEEEKRRIQAVYDAETSASTSAPPAWSAPPPISSLPPFTLGGSTGPLEFQNRPLNAAEEKARLRAQYEAEEKAASSAEYQSQGAGGYSAPPPEFISQSSWQNPPNGSSFALSQQPAASDQYYQSPHAPHQSTPAVEPPPPPPVVSPRTSTFSSDSTEIYSPVPTRPQPMSIPSQISSQHHHTPLPGDGEVENHLGESGHALSRDPSISLGKKRETVDFENPPAPPLLPRPPVEYVRESEKMNENGTAWDPPNVGGLDFSLEMRPFSPLDLSFGEKPPIPAKVPI